LDTTRLGKLPPSIRSMRCGMNDQPGQTHRPGAQQLQSKTEGMFISNKKYSRRLARINGNFFELRSSAMDADPVLRFLRRNHFDLLKSACLTFHPLVHCFDLGDQHVHLLEVSHESRKQFLFHMSTRLSILKRRSHILAVPYPALGSAPDLREERWQSTRWIDLSHPLWIFYQDSYFLHCGLK